MSALKISISSMISALKFLKILSAKFKFGMPKLLFSTEYKQEVSDFSLSYDGSALEKCVRFTEGATEIRQPFEYRIILFENLCYKEIMLDLKILISITISALKFLKI
jgi:hypothetical protein